MIVVYRVLLDTNVLVSAVVTDGPARALVTNIDEHKQYVVISSLVLVAEVLRVLSRPKFKPEWDVLRILRLILFETVPVKSEFKAVLDDPADDAVINTAYDGRADYVVSGDGHLLKMKEFKGIPIVTISRMRDVLRAGPA